MDTPNIFSYRNYREYLKEYHAFRKSIDKAFSHRSFAKKAGYSSSGFYSNVVHGVHNLTKRYIPLFINGLELLGDDALYFELMVHYTHADSPQSKQIYLEQMIDLMPKTVKMLKQNQSAFYETWYHAVVLAALTIIDIVDEYQELAQFINPPIKKLEAKRSLLLLKELKLIDKDDQGFYKPVDQKLFGGEEVGVFKIHQFQSQMMTRAMQAQEMFTPKERYITTKTISASKDGLERIKKMAHSFALEVDRISHADVNSDQVLQLNVQCFPLTQSREGYDE
ncbi:MAG: TIGR02147 family protein [Fibrobacterales bacterium]